MNEESQKLVIPIIILFAGILIGALLINFSNQNECSDFIKPIPIIERNNSNITLSLSKFNNETGNWLFIAHLNNITYLNGEIINNTANELTKDEEYALYISSNMLKNVMVQK